MKKLGRAFFLSVSTPARPPPPTDSQVNKGVSSGKHSRSLRPCIRKSDTTCSAASGETEPQVSSGLLTLGTVLSECWDRPCPHTTLTFFVDGSVFPFPSRNSSICAGIQKVFIPMSPRVVFAARVTQRNSGQGRRGACVTLRHLAI